MRARAFTASLVVLVVASAQDQAPVFRSTAESVRVDVEVTRDGRPVTGLTPSDFEVLDNGVPQRVDYAGLEAIPLNLVFVIDGSSSVDGERAERLRRACQAMLAELKGDDQAGLVVFGDSVIVGTPLTRNLGLVRDAVDQPLPLGQTALVDAVQAGVLLAESEPGRALVIVFSDGVEVTSYLPADAVVETAKRSDAVVYAVALRGVGRPPFLRDVAEASGGELFEIESARDIEAAFRGVIESFRHRYLVSYTPSGVDRAGWHQLRVRVKARGASVKARPGYTR
jgi:VWFA-related protein